MESYSRSKTLMLYGLENSVFLDVPKIRNNDEFIN